MVSTPEGCTNSSSMTPHPYVCTKKLSSIKYIFQFTETLYVKHRTAVCMFGASKEKCKAIKKENVLWLNIAKHRGYTKINHNVTESLYHCILHHPQVVQYRIENDCIYVSIEGNPGKS